MPTDYRNPTSDFAVGGTVGYSSGAEGFSLVNDYPDTADPLTSYVQLGTTNNSFIAFGFTAFTVPTTATNISVAVDYYDEEPSNGANSSAGRLRIGGTYYDSATHNPGTTTTQRTKTWATNPRTSAAWTPAEVNGTDGTNPLQHFGVIGPDSNPVWRLGAIRIGVTYTVPPQSFAPDLATGSGQSYDPAFTPGPASFAPDLATGSGQSYDPTIEIVTNNQNFAPDAATGTGAAYDPTTAASGAAAFAPDVATGTGAASDATIAGGSISLTPDTATGSGAAYSATIAASGAISFAPATATGSGQSYDGAIDFAAEGQSFEPDTATGSGQAYDVAITPKASFVGGRSNAIWGGMYTPGTPPRPRVSCVGVLALQPAEVSGVAKLRLRHVASGSMTLSHALTSGRATEDFSREENDLAMLLALTTAKD